MTIDNFSGEYAFLSNFYNATVKYEGEVYPTSEHAFQAAKTTDPQERKKIRRSGTPSQAKKMGNAVKLRPGWDSMRVEVMRTIVLDKFTRNPDIRQRLLDTGDEKLVESNTWRDSFWGVYGGKGENYLGRILMAVRDRLAKEARQ